MVDLGQDCRNNDNGPEPEVGSWVIASYGWCPDRVAWRRYSNGWDYWVDRHGCRHSWSELVDPIDCLPPSEWREPEDA